MFNKEGNKVTLSATDFSGNYSKSYANMLDGSNGTYCCGVWDASDEGHDYFEVELPEELDGAFSFSFITENTTMNAKAFRIEILYEEKEDVAYTFVIDAPTGAQPTVTYNSEPVEANQTFDPKTLDVSLFYASEIEGYTWSIGEEDNHTPLY